MNFSVLMSVYIKDNPDFLDASIKSIINQTLPPNEIVVVKDGFLTKELDDILIQYSDCNLGLFKILCLKENIGLGMALNFGINHCKFNIIARMDADDICYYERFEKQINFLKNNPEISAVGSSIQEFNAVPGDIRRYKIPPSMYSQLKKYAIYRNPLNHPTVMFKKNHVVNVGSYMHMPLFEDYFLWARILTHGYQIMNMQEPLLHFRIGNDMVGRRHGFCYLMKELAFLRAIRAIKFLAWHEYYFSLLIKLPLRLIPKKLFKLLYSVILR